MNASRFGLRRHATDLLQADCFWSCCLGCPYWQFRFMLDKRTFPLTQVLFLTPLEKIFYKMATQSLPAYPLRKNSRAEKRIRFASILTPASSCMPSSIKEESTWW